MALHTLFNSLRSTTTQSGQKVTYYSLPALEEAVAARKAVKLEAAAEKRSANRKPAAPRAAKTKAASAAA